MFIQTPLGRFTFSHSHHDYFCVRASKREHLETLFGVFGAKALDYQFQSTKGPAQAHVYFLSHSDYLLLEWTLKDDAKKNFTQLDPLGSHLKPSTQGFLLNNEPQPDGSWLASYR